MYASRSLEYVNERFPYNDKYEEPRAAGAEYAQVPSSLVGILHVWFRASMAHLLRSGVRARILFAGIAAKQAHILIDFVIMQEVCLLEGLHTGGKRDCLLVNTKIPITASCIANNK